MLPGLLPEYVMLPQQWTQQWTSHSGGGGGCVWRASRSLVTPKSDTVQRNFQKTKGVLIWDEKEKQKYLEHKIIIKFF